MSRSERQQAHAARLHSFQQPTPAKIEARRVESDKRLREARNAGAAIRVRLQPYICGKGQHPFRCLIGEAILITVDEPVDVRDLLQDTLRFWRAWRPSRRRRSMAAITRAWEALELAATDLKP